MVGIGGSSGGIYVGHQFINRVLHLAQHLPGFSLLQCTLLFIIQKQIYKGHKARGSESPLYQPDLTHDNAEY